MERTQPGVLSLAAIFDRIRGYKKALVAGNAVAILATLVSVPTPLLIPVLVDEVLLHRSSTLTHWIDTHIMPMQTFGYVVTILLATVLLRFAYTALSILQTKIFMQISKDVTYKIRIDALEHLKRISMKAYETSRSGSIAAKLVTDVETIDTFIASTVSRLIISVLTLVGIAGVLLWIHWGLALFIIVLNPLVITFTTKLARRVSKLKKEENRAIEVFQSALTETLDLFGQIRASNQERRFFGALQERAKEVRQRSIAFGWKSDAASRISYLTFLAGYELFRAASILAVAFSDLSIGMMLAVFGYLWYMVTPVQDILGIQYALHNARAAIARINGIFAMPTEPAYGHRKNPFEAARVGVRLQDVSFGYSPGTQVLHAVHFEAKPGRRVALVGASGSGKTTLAQLIVGFYPPESGTLAFNGVDIREIGLDRVRTHVNLVLQSPKLFHDTIRFNITLGRDVPEKRIWDALEMAQMRAVIESFESGLETVVGREGIKLSGGQRQRIAIARMIVADPKIAILDESTSALDVHTEARLYEALEPFFAARTTITIAHRLSTIRKADYIYILENGHIVEEGTHEELLKKEGVYMGYIKQSGECDGVV
ncbi:ABC transporter ATP-binding protein [Hydrogenimonas urashimensis]|uniref:ABC transporter ATP-binding protein n=1 Tax=Hydrogenimonas urashimensis TaxID=2740515 RepID=UPI00191501C7|nr:ABC transporter ATP-binding protein [Hydrogenimonas urashimensis]